MEAPNYTTNPIHLLGFQTLHEKGITGKGQTIAIIESIGGLAASIKPEGLQKRESEGAIKIYDCSVRPHVLNGAENLNSQRYPLDKDLDGFIQDIYREPIQFPREATFRNHEIQTTYLAIGTGGAAPAAVCRAYDVMTNCRVKLQLRDFDFYIGEDLYSYSQLIDLAIENRCLGKPITQTSEPFDWDNSERVESRRRLYRTKLESISDPLQQALQNNIIDSSLLQAITQACQHGRCIINMSMGLSIFCDPFNQLKVPVNILDTIGSALKNSDSILVLAATNLDGQKDLYVNNYLRCFANHSEIKKRLLIVISLEERPKREAFEKNALKIDPIEVVFPNNEARYVRPALESNIPLNNGWESCAISSLGTNILFPDGSKSSGTSLAAPTVAGLCALVREVYPDLMGDEVVEHIKSHAIQLYNNTLFGHGLINPPRSCGVEEAAWGCFIQ